MQNEITIEYEVISLASGKVLSRPDEATPYHAVELRGETSPQHALEVLRTLHSTADEIVYRSSLDDDATLIYTRIPALVTRPMWVHVPAWTSSELLSQSTNQSADTETSLDLYLSQGKKFLASVYTHNPYTKKHVRLVGPTDTLTFLTTAHWFMLGNAEITYAP